MSAAYQDAVRLQTSVLSAAERRLLIRLAGLLPSWITSDQLTVVALLAMAAAGASYWLASVSKIGLVLVVLFLAVNWFGDSLDGTVARVRQCQRPRYGFYVDHVIDAVGTLFLLAGLGASGYMSPLVAVSLLVAYFLLLIEIYLATSVLKTFRMALFKIGPTELRIILAIGNLVLLTHPTTTVFGRRVLLFDVGGIVAATGLLVAFAVSCLCNTRRLYLEEPLPPKAG